jgi:hypothetical protein
MSNSRDAALAQVAAKQHAIFASWQLAPFGYSVAARQVRLSTGRWVLLFDNVYRMGGAPPTWRSDVLAACWAAGPTALASHRAAASLWGLPSGRTTVVEITCKRWRRTRHSGLVVHESLVIDDEDCDQVSHTRRRSW